MEAIIKLLILLAVSDHELHEKEKIYINKVIKNLKSKIDINEALEEINAKFRDDFDTACKFYLKAIIDKENRAIATDSLRIVILLTNFLNLSIEIIIL